MSIIRLPSKPSKERAQCAMKESSQPPVPPLTEFHHFNKLPKKVRLIIKEARPLGRCKWDTDSAPLYCILHRHELFQWCKLKLDVLSFPFPSAWKGKPPVFMESFLKTMFLSHPWAFVVYMRFTTVKRISMRCYISGEFNQCIQFSLAPILPIFELESSCFWSS